MSNIKLAELPDWNPPLLAVDLETTGLDPITNRPLSIALSDGQWVWIWLHTHQLPDRLWELLTDPNVKKLAHNMVFDAAFIKYHYGYDITNNVWDTLLIESNLNNNQGIPNSLYDVAARRCGILMDKDTRKEFENHPGFDVRPVTGKQIQYMADDVLYLPEIYKQQLSEAEIDRLIPSCKLDLQVIPIAVDMRLQGMNLDVELWNTYLEQFDAMLEGFEYEVKHLLGNGYTHTILRQRDGEDTEIEYALDEINLRSYDHVKAIMKSLGHPVKSTGVKILEPLLTDGSVDTKVRQFVDLVLQHRSWTKAKGWDYPQFVNEITRKVHPGWKLNGAYTGRFSCEKPNIQQAPKPRKGQPNLRNVWIPDSEDYVLFIYDYSQQEPRILGQLCQDSKLLEACNSEDVYIEFAKYLFNRTVEKGSEERQIAKQFVLAVGYGAFPDTLSVTSGLPIKRCSEIRDLILNTFPGIDKWGWEQYHRMKSFGYVTTLLGRRMYFTKRFEQKRTNAINNPVQGTAAEMFKLASVDTYSYLQKNKVDGRIWAGIHDEIIVHAHRKYQDELQVKLPQLMEEAGSKLCPDVLHVAEGKVLERWDK